MPDTIASLQGQNEQGKMVFNHGKQYFILGRIESSFPSILRGMPSLWILCLRLPSAIPQNAPRIEEQRLRTTRAYGTLDVS